MITLPTYVTREALADALDVPPSGVEAAALDRAITSGSRAVETRCRRVFWPQVEARLLDWPAVGDLAPGYRLYLGANELGAAPTAITSGGVTISTGDVIPGPAELGPPFGYLDIDTSSAAAWSSGTTWQSSTSITGPFCGCEITTRTVGALAASLTSSATAVVVDGPAAAGVGVGDLLNLGTERALVTDRTWVDTTVDATLDADSSVVSFTGAGFAAGERLLIESERMRVVDVAGTTVTVRRAVDGSVLAAHTAASVYASRSLTVERGYGGTTAAAHDSADDVDVQVYPGLVAELALAEALVAKVQEGGAYARPQGSGESSRGVASGTLADVRARCEAEHRRYRDAAI